MEIRKPVENVLEETLKNLKSIVDVNSIVGKPITEGDSIIIPISRVSVGFVSGGGEYDNKRKKRVEFNYPFAGGSGGGCNISPIGFLVVYNGKVDFIKINCENNLEKTIDVIADFLKSVK